MFSKKTHKLTGTLSFRITIWYAVIFTITSLLALSIFYYRISVITMNNTDTELLEELHEFTILMDAEGSEQVMKGIVFEAEEEGKNVFYRLISHDGQILKAMNMENFGTIDISIKALMALNKKEKYVLETMDPPAHDYKVRTIYGVISPSMIFNMGISLEDNYEYLSIFRNLIVVLMIPLFFLAPLIGWFLARHALKGVEEVTQTAIKISEGSIDKRVEVKKRSYEINRLANTFNNMLDRIQSLIKGMKETNDNIAHDLRSPVARIRGIAEMTLMRNDSIEDYGEMAANTIEECDNLIDIINTMLDITETEAGVGKFKTEKVEIIELILAACELFSPIAKEKNVKLVTFLPDNLCIQGDKSKLQRLVTNLLENAIKYNKPGGSVTVSLTKKDHQIDIQFQDTGIGIAENDLPKIFERFYRCDASRAQSGIGLGLSLAKAIAKGLGGDINVKSILNQGSSFSVSLPA
jgi:signal transduction histidine kinase